MSNTFTIGNLISFIRPVSHSSYSAVKYTLKHRKANIFLFWKMNPLYELLSPNLPLLRWNLNTSQTEENDALIVRDTYPNAAIWLVRYGFFGVLAAITQESSDKNTLYWESLRFYCSFINLTEWRERRVKCQQQIGDIKHTWKNILFFHVCCYGFSQGWKSLYKTVVYKINPCYMNIQSGW